MSRLTDLMIGKALGSASTPDAPDGSMPPFLLNILKNFGITPESITAYADTIKTAVTQMRDDMATCKAKLIVLEEELADLKATTRRAMDSEAASLEPIPEAAPDLNSAPWPTVECANCRQSTRSDLIGCTKCGYGAVEHPSKPN